MRQTNSINDEKTFNDFTFYFNTNQPFINQGILLSRTINPYLVGFIDDNVFGNYILFWYHNLPWIILRIDRQ